MARYHALARVQIESFAGEASFEDIGLRLAKAFVRFFICERGAKKKATYPQEVSRFSYAIIG